MPILGCLGMFMPIRPPGEGSRRFGSISTSLASVCLSVVYICLIFFKEQVSIELTQLEICVLASDPDLEYFES